MGEVKQAAKRWLFDPFNFEIPESEIMNPHEWPFGDHIPRGAVVLCLVKHDTAQAWLLDPETATCAMHTDNIAIIIQTQVKHGM